MLLAVERRLKCPGVEVCLLRCVCLGGNGHFNPMRKQPRPAASPPVRRSERLAKKQPLYDRILKHLGYYDRLAEKPAPDDSVEECAHVSRSPASRNHVSKRRCWRADAMALDIDVFADNDHVEMLAYQQYQMEKDAYNEEVSSVKVEESRCALKKDEVEGVLKEELEDEMELAHEADRPLLKAWRQQMRDALLHGKREQSTPH